MRGDRPRVIGSLPRVEPFTPHARGSTANVRKLLLQFKVYPACAGIDPSSLSRNSLLLCLPRMRGDRPRGAHHKQAQKPFTPHARGSTHRHRWTGQMPQVYPACAGIDLDLLRMRPSHERLPRMRGDRPFDFFAGFRFEVFTPHARGSTLNPTTTFADLWVYPACAGIDRIHHPDPYMVYRLPRMRGDRPPAGPGTGPGFGFTPHARGSTHP